MQAEYRLVAERSRRRGRDRVTPELEIWFDRLARDLRRPMARDVRVK